MDHKTIRAAIRLAGDALETEQAMIGPADAGDAINAEGANASTAEVMDLAYAFIQFRKIVAARANRN